MKEHLFPGRFLLLMAPLFFSVGQASEAGGAGEVSRLPSGGAHLDRYIQSVESTNGLTLGISILQANRGTNTTELPIGLVLKMAGKEGTTVYVPKEDYLARLELYDSTGRALPQTDLGAKYGRRFADLQWNLKLASQPHGHPQMIFVKDTWTWCCRLPPAAELFAVTKPGAYRLKLEVQVMLLYLHDKQVRQIIRFPPVEVAVTRPSPAQARSR